MIQITPQMRVLVAIQPVDFRRGIDGLSRVAREELSRDPMSGWVFLFRNRRSTAIKLLVYDGQGFWLAQKRLSAGKFRYWPAGPPATGRILEAHAVQVLLWAGDFEAARVAPTWRTLEPAVS
jgi:hypothetical protein